MTSTVNTCHFLRRPRRSEGNLTATLRITGPYGTDFRPYRGNTEPTEDDHRRAAELYLVEHHAPADLSDAPGRLSPSGTAYTFTLTGE